MKIINEKGKLFGLINIIDLGVLLLVLALAAGGFMYMNRKEAPPQAEMQEYHITLKCSGYGDDVVNAIKVGARLYYSSGLTDIVITDVRVEPAKVDVNTSDGRIVVQDHPTLKDIYVTVKLKDSLDDPMIYINNLHVTVGKDITLKTTRVEVPAKVTSIVE